MLEDRIQKQLAQEMISPYYLVNHPGICKIVVKVSPSEYYASLMSFASKKPRDYDAIRSYFQKFKCIHDRETSLFRQITLTNTRIDYVLDYVAKEFNK